MVSFRDISKLYCYMFQFSICTQFLYSKQYQTDYFVLQNNIKLNIFKSNQCKIEFTLCKLRFCLKNEMKLIFLYNDPKMIFQIMTVHLQKTKFFIISASKFKRYYSKNCHFSYLIVSYRIVSILNCILSLFHLNFAIFDEEH